MNMRATGPAPVDGATYCEVRGVTEALAAPLSPEDQTVQTMPDVSPTKWHRAHTSWFFETFLLSRFAPGYGLFDPAYGFLFNSYYEAVGPRHARPNRGHITRPGVEEIARYREHVDQAMVDFVYCGVPDEVAPLVELGVHHEQQHQELIVMDIKHVLSCNPTVPAYGKLPWSSRDDVAPHRDDGWLAHEGGIVAIGHDGDGFAFDNEGPVHDELLRPFEIASQVVTNRQWIDFMADGGYRRPELWMSDGWYAVQANGWASPSYWFERDGEWDVYGLAGLEPVDLEAPVCHVSWFEADAFARWAGARLPTEFEWEASAPAPGSHGWYGNVWQWTASPYSPYPGFRPASGAVGEYNGKFMVNQFVLRGSCLATPPGHARRTYRNFFPPSARWAFAGVRLARDV